MSDVITTASFTLTATPARTELLAKYFRGLGDPNSPLADNHDLRKLLASEGIEEQIELRRVETIGQAERERFLGSPTVRIDGTNVDPAAAGREDFGLKCRLYRTGAGLEPVPLAEWIRAALRGAG